VAIPSNAKLVRLPGPSLSNRKTAMRILDDINECIEKYMLMLLPTNLVVALLSWIAFRWIGLENAGAWAAATGLLHVVPYLGPGVTALATGMAAFMQFQSLPVALLVAGSSLAIATLVGILVTTWMTGRIAHMNSTAVFISQPAQHIEYCAQLPHDLAFRHLRAGATGKRNLAWNTWGRYRWRCLKSQTGPKRNPHARAQIVCAARCRCESAM
jgi:AI-2E family transporter